jgi:two-component system phosphate regulon sensor histidine kinase PhoR
MSMKKTITKQLAILGGISIVLTMILTVLVYYSIFRKQIFEELSSNAKIVKNVFSSEEAKVHPYLPSHEGIRITVVNHEGTVLYDSSVDATKMENHLNRPEIKAAFASGEGKSIRHSDTLNTNTYYYALQLDQDTVLRVAKDSQSVLSLFNETLPIIIIGVLILFVICLFMAQFLTRKIITPIQRMTSEIEKYEEFHVNVPYQELKPFAQTIWNQHENISQQLKELEKSERIRQEFTANVSHELKTPLTSISGYAELIENGMTKTEDLSRFGSEIRKNATRLLHLINDILELSELDEADIDVVKEPVDLYEIAKKCVELLVLSARKHQVNLTLTGSKSIVNANKDMMEELINNLCDNAIRYNRPGGSVNVNIYKDGEFTKLVVKDTGIGIPKEHLERIFERFYRVDKSRSKETGGTGLGLAIVKHIVAKHGEQLHIESEVGVGTVITIEL